MKLASILGIRGARDRPKDSYGSTAYSFSFRDRGLCPAFKVRRSTATEILKAMERKKLIVRTSLPEDKRKKKILLTDSAIKLFQTNWEKIVQTEQQIAKGLTQEEISTFMQILGKIQNNLDTD